DIFFFSSRRRHTRFSRDWSSDVCSSDLADAVHAVVPIAAAEQRQTVGAEREALVEAARAVLIEGAGFVRDGRLEGVLVLCGLESRAFQERNHLIQNACIVGRTYIMGSGECQPGAVVGNPRAHALPGMGQP